MDSLSEIVEIYKQDVDRTLVDACLIRTIQERIQALEDFEAFVEELRAGVARSRQSVVHDKSGGTA
jgi:hypothetical protein